jgi:hypothetical protein
MSFVGIGTPGSALNESVLNDPTTDHEPSGLTSRAQAVVVA